uniref:Uncharacterized protein n=1 Tax=Anopheles atroparvus TaxID=41427 RepID=A0A182INZ5_ANOAO
MEGSSEASKWHPFIRNKGSKNSEYSEKRGPGPEEEAAETVPPVAELERRRRRLKRLSPLRWWLPVGSNSSFESSSCTLISSSESSLGAGLTESGLEEAVVAAYDRERPAKRAAAEVGTSDRNALCSPPINNGVDAVTNDAAWAAATAAAAWAPSAAAA